jgi:arylsulfatase A-like enzyme
MLSLAISVLALAFATAGPKPNIILILTDDQGYGDMSCHGNPILKTPNIDRLHRASLRFTDCLVSPTCAPTRSALLTGRHEFKNGVTHTVYERERLTLKAVTLPEILKQNGYSTGIFGKWHLGDEDAYMPGRRGYDEVCIHGAGGIGQSYPGSCGDAPNNRYFDPYVWHNDRFEKSKGYCTDVFFTQALNWIEKSKGSKPFFCHIATNAPHVPLNVKPDDEARYTGKVNTADLAKFYGMIANIDDNIGTLLDKLTDWKIDRETLVIFMNDNGGTVGCSVFNAGMRGQKNTPWRGGTRAASFWRWPGTITPRDVGNLASHTDVTPTILDLIEVKRDETMSKQIEGRSHAALLKGAKVEDTARTLFTHIGRWPNGAKIDDWKYANCSVRTKQWQMVNTDKDRRKNWQLFDLTIDPGETTNIAADHPDIILKLDAEYVTWWASVTPMMVNENVTGPKQNPYRERFEKQYGAIPDAPAKPSP